MDDSTLSPVGAHHAGADAVGAATLEGVPRSDSALQPAAAGQQPVSDETPEAELYDSPIHLRQWLRNSSAVIVSAAVHMVAMVVLGLIVIEPPRAVVIQELISEVLDESDMQDELTVELENQLVEMSEPTEQVFSASLVVGEVGAAGPQGLVSAPTMDKSLLEQVAHSDVKVEGLFLEMPSSSKLIAEAPDGQVGDARAVVDSYQEALDRITQEIVWMLDKGPVLVVWVFDQSISMKDDQQEIRDRIEHVYRQLGIVSQSNEDALQTAIVSYGNEKNFTVHTRRPTHDRGQIMEEIDAVPVDPSGKEYMCSAVINAIGVHRQYAQKSRRQLALIVVTDERGEADDNQRNLEKAIAEAKSAGSRVYVLGREAVFGYPYAHIRWVHPQTKRVHWLRIDRGPETAFVEQLQTNGFHRRHDAFPAGFGPYTTTRLARETGGIFFMLPSLETDLVRGEKRNYDMQTPYYPDLRSRLEVKKDIDASPLRTMLEKVIYDLDPYNEQARRIIEMRVEFSVEPDVLLRQIRQEQSKATVYLAYLAKAEKTVGEMESLRQQEASPRWQANYDLLYAQLVAYQARMYEYGAYLEEFLRDYQTYLRNPGDPNNKFRPPPRTRSPNLTHVEWDIRTRRRTITEEAKPYIERARVMFQQVVEDHPGTPWAARAEFELGRGFGVELVADYDIPHPNPTGRLIEVPSY